jgi:FkbM family methyltransferase
MTFFFDVGAGIGTLSCVVGCHTPEGSVHAFEPLPANVRAIQQNLSQNSFNAEVYQHAFSDENKQISFTIPSRTVEAGYTNAALLPNHTESNFWDDKKETIEISAKRGDDLIDEENIPIPNIVSIDVEGAEMKVIQGLEEALSNDECRALFCEVHEYLLSDFDTTSQRLENKIRQIGFDIQTWDHREYEMEGESKSLYRIAAFK